MNTYIIPISDGDSCWIEQYCAPSVEDAENQLMRDVIDNREYDVTDLDFDLFCKQMKGYGVVIGEMEDTILYIA